MLTLALVVSMAMMTSCGKEEFGVTDNSEKSMTINAQNAGKDLFFLSGSLELEEGQKIEITSALEKGTVELGFVSSEGMDNIDELPDTEAEPMITAIVTGEEVQTYGMTPGSYLVKATVLEKATGTITINVVAD